MMLKIAYFLWMCITLSLGEQIKILGGNEVPQDAKYPFMCSIRGRSGGHICGATLVGSRLAITGLLISIAMHCISLVKHERIFVNSYLLCKYAAAECVESGFGAGKQPTLWCGATKLDSSEPLDQFVAVRTKQHECWERRYYHYDIALIELNATGVYSNAIPELIQTNDFKALKSGYTITALGWGYTNAQQTSLPTTLQTAQLRLLDSASCEATWPVLYNQNVAFCAGSENNNSIDTSQGDSGGPVIDFMPSKTENKTVSRQLGIVSFGAPSKPGVYTRIDPFNNWITSNGYCACTQIGISGYTSVGSNNTGCIYPKSLSTSSTILESSESWCYVVDPQRCPKSRPSKHFKGAGWILCKEAVVPAEQCL